VAINPEAFKVDKKTDDIAKQIAQKLVEGRSREELLGLAGMVVRQQAESNNESPDALPGMPQTPDELHEHIIKRYGVSIARVSVCEDHDTPFDYVCAGFFEWYPNVFGIGPRGGGKSYDQALLHDLNSEWKPGCESATFGAVEEQAKRVYAAFKTFVNRDNIVGEPKISETVYKPTEGMNYGSKVEVLGGTVAAVNGPHPQKAHSDEVEIMRADTWKESRNLASAKTTPTGQHIKAQNYGTSTMKWKGGRVWQILESFKHAKQKAIERYGDNKELVDDLITKTTTFYVMIWCIFEVAEQVPNCFPGSTLVESDAVSGGFKRWYEGPLVKVVDAAGDELSGTPNHPVLTTAGWKPMGELDEGDQLVRATRRENVSAADPDVEDVPASIEEVFGFLEVTASNRVTRVGVDFHGDVADGDVDVVLADRVLRVAGKTSLLQPVDEHLFADSYSGARASLASSTGGKLCLCRSRPTTSDVGSGGQALSLLERHTGHAQSHRFASAAGLDAVADEEASDGAAGDAVILGQHLMGGAFEITTSDVVDVQRLDWSGHVFNLQTETGAYSSNNIVAHNCREAPENADLPEWEPGLLRKDCKCDCHEIVNGQLEAQDENDEPLPRTLASECGGRFYRSRGHRTRDEVIQLFLQNDPGTWSAQQLCRETETEGLYLPNFSRHRHGLSRFPFDFANGPIYTGTDWGFTDEAAVVWVQYLERAVEAIRYDGAVIVLPRGSRVAFSELTKARLTATELGQQAIMREIKLANVLSISRIPVRRRWADIQGAGDRRDWAKMGLKTAKYSSRSFDEHVKEWRGMVDANRFFVVVDSDRFTEMGCPALCEQIEGWREEDGKESRELPQHVVSATRYLMYGMHDVYNDSGAQSPEQQEAVKLSTVGASTPGALPYQSTTTTGSMVTYVPTGNDDMAAETGWRAQV